MNQIKTIRIGKIRNRKEELLIYLMSDLKKNIEDCKKEKNKNKKNKKKIVTGKSLLPREKLFWPIWLLK